MQALESGGKQVAYTDSYQVIQTKIGNEWIRTSKFLRFSVDFSQDRIFARNIAPVNCFMHTRKSFLDAGGFDESLLVLEDWDLWIRLATKYDFVHIREITCEVKFRTEKQNMSFQREDEYAKATYKINKKHNGLVYQSRDKFDSISVKRNMRIVSEFERIKRSQSLREALVFLEDRLSGDVFSPYLEYFCAQACLESGKATAAKAHLEKCIDLSPTDPDAFNDLAVIEYSEFKNVEVAVSLLEQSLRLDPKHKDSRMNLIDIHLEKGDFDDAVANLMTLLRLYPNDAEVIAKMNYAQKMSANSNGVFDFHRQS